MPAISALEADLLFQLRATNLPMPEREYRFYPGRKWRFDFAWPSRSLAVEVEGGVWTGGRHVRGAGFTQDCAKYNAASMRGWRVLRFTRAMVESGEALETISEALTDPKSATSAGGIQAPSGAG